MSGTWNPSMREAIADLPVGDSYAKTRRYTSAELSELKIVSELGAMKNTLNAAMRRAALDTGNQYTLETGSTLTRSGAILLIAAVTRIG